MKSDKITDRYNSGDIIRGISILLMIFVHIYVLWTRMNYGLIGQIIQYFGGWASAFFILSAGINYFLFINARIIEQNSKKEIFCEILKISLVLFLVTLLFLFFFGFRLNMYISFIIYWSVFQVISFSMLLYFIIPFLKRNIRIIISVLLIIFIFFTYWLIEFYKITFLFIFISGGTFTYLPWANFFVFGMLIGDIITNISIEQLKRILKIFSLLGISFFIIWITWIRTSKNPYFFVLFFWVYTGFFLLFPLIIYFTDLKKHHSFIQDTLIHWGIFSYSIYYLHFIIIMMGLLFFPFIITDFYSDGLSMYLYFILVPLICIGIEIFIRIWKKFNYVLGFEWFINKITKKSSFIKNNI